jgi:hypothetical protein
VALVKRFQWEIRLGSSLLIISAILYLFHYLIFQDAKFMFSIMTVNVAFVPLSVVIVTLVLNRLLTYRDKKAKLNRLNMVIGAFYSEAGTPLLKVFCNLDPNCSQIRDDLIVNNHWSEREFQDLSKRIKGYDSRLQANGETFETLKQFLESKREFLLRLLENPNLMEHDSFTDLLWAVFHLADELAHRADVQGLPKGDIAHLSVDMKRAYVLLIVEWLAYMQHLKTDYPYLFSLALRVNPFDPEASPVVLEAPQPALA